MLAASVSATHAALPIFVVRGTWCCREHPWQRFQRLPSGMVDDAFVGLSISGLSPVFSSGFHTESEVLQVSG